MSELDGALSAPATFRNRGPILAVLRRLLPPAGLVLEIASGTGEHAAFLAARLPGLSWLPTDPDPAALGSIAAHRAGAGAANLLPPLPLDASAAEWPVGSADAIVCINMIHIAPWESAEGLMAGAGRILPPGGLLYLYGPFREPDRPLAASNAEFDESLKARDPRFGLRDLDTVRALAAASGLAFAERIEMPANNLSLAFRREAGPGR